MAIHSIILFFVFCVLFFFGQLQRLEIGQFPPFYLHDLVLFVWLMFIFFVNRKKIIKLLRSIRINKYKLEIFLFAWIILGWIVAFINGQLAMKFLFYTLRFVTYGLVFYLIHKFKIIKENYLSWGYFFIGFYLVLFGLLQYVFLPDMRFLSILGWDDHYYRLIGTQFDPNFMGIIFVLLFFNFNKLKLKKKKDVKHFLLFLILIAVSLTFSRATYLSFLVGTILLSKFNFKGYVYAILLVILIFLSPKPGGEGVDLTRTTSISARVESSQKTIQSLQPYQYLIGQGLFNKQKDSYIGEDYERSDHAQLEDNFILLIFNATGIVGLVLVSIILSKKLVKLYKIDQVGMVSIIIVLTHSFFNNTVFQPFVFIFLLWGLISKVKR